MSRPANSVRHAPPAAGAPPRLLRRHLDSKSVSVRTVQAAPQAPDDLGNVWSVVQGQVFAGILGGELKPVTAGDEDVSGHRD